MNKPAENVRIRKKRVIIIILAVILSLDVILAAALMFIFRHLYNRTVFIDDSEVEATTMTLPSEEEEKVVTLEPSVEESLKEEVALTEKAEETAEETAKETETETEAPDAMDKIYNILLVGVDRRDRSWNGNSDAMILITINN